MLMNSGELVRGDDDGQLFLGAGAEPLSHPRLLSTGHQDVDRPSGATQFVMIRKEEIVGDQSRKEDYRLDADVKG